ncbi:kappa-type opioid receptor-like [Glandiceps talaboti]
MAEYNITLDDTWASDSYSESFSPDFLCITEDNLKDHLVSDADAAIITMAMPIVFVIGCLGNVLTIFVILRIKEMRTVTNYFLVNLAVADLFFLFMVVPPKFLKHVVSSIHLEHNENLFGEAGCKLFSYSPRVAQGVSCFIILTLTIERYFAVCWPLKYRMIRTKRKAVFVGVGLWMFAGVFALPHVYFPGIIVRNITCSASLHSPELPDMLKSCYPCLDQCDFYLMYSKIDEIIFLCVVPVLVVLYILMLRRLRSATRFVRAAHVKSSNSMAAKRQLIRMLGVTVTVYLICVGSFRVFGLMMVFDNTYSSHTVVLNVTRVLLYINAAINPIIYNMFSRTYRAAFRRVLCCQVNTTLTDYESVSESVALTTTDDIQGSRKSLRRSRTRSRKTVHRNGSCSRPNGSIHRANGSNRRSNGSSRQGQWTSQRTIDHSCKTENCRQTAVQL